MKLKFHRCLINTIRALSLTIVVSISACGGGGSDENGQANAQPTPSTAAEPASAAKATLQYDTGGTVTVLDKSSPIYGASVFIAPSSLGADKEDITINYEDALPGSFSKEALDAGAVKASKILVLNRTSTNLLSQPAEVTIPYDKSVVKDTMVPLVLYWDEAAKKYSPVAVKSIDRSAGTITFYTAHFSRYLVAVLNAIADTAGLSVPSTDTGFLPNIDGFYDHNFGAYDSPGGSCFGMANYSGWYFDTKKAVKGKGLTGLYRDGDPIAEEDDQNVRELISRAFIASSQAMGFQKLADMQAMGDKWTGYYLISSLTFSKSPQTLLMTNSQGKEGHAVTVYKYDKDNGRFEIYDNNYPGEIVTLNWNPILGFGAYSKYNGTYTKFAFDSMHSSFSPAFFESLYQGIESGWDKSKFAQITIQQPSSLVSQPGSIPLYEVAADTNVLIQGNVPRIANEDATKNRYAFIYYAGRSKPEAVVPVDGSGNFTVNLNQLPFSTSNDIMILVAQSKNRWIEGFTAFKQIQVKVTGQSFFKNVGFEKASFESWLSERHLWTNSTQVIPSDKSAIVTSGFDPIATDLSLTRFGKYAARINNSEANYPISSLTQTATLSQKAKPTLRFHWAAVLEDPQHSPSDQPYVDVSVFNKTKGVTLYHKKYYANDPTYSGWKSYRNGQWKSIPWQVVDLDLSQYVGDEITLKVEAAACGLGAHGGYAYLDAEE